MKRDARYKNRCKDGSFIYRLTEDPSRFPWWVYKRKLPTDPLNDPLEVVINVL